MLERVIFKIFRVVFWYGVFRFWCSVFGVFGHQLSGNTVLLQNKNKPGKWKVAGN